MNLFWKYKKGAVYPEENQKEYLMNIVEGINAASFVKVTDKIRSNFARHNKSTGLDEVKEKIELRFLASFPKR